MKKISKAEKQWWYLITSNAMKITQVMIVVEEWLLSHDLLSTVVDAFVHCWHTGSVCTCVNWMCKCCTRSANVSEIHRLLIQRHCRGDLYSLLWRSYLLSNSRISVVWFFYFLFVCFCFWSLILPSFTWHGNWEIICT